MHLPSLDPPTRLLMGSGPSNPEPRVLRALATQPLAGDDPALVPFLDSIVAGTRFVFQTSSACAFPVAGASRSGIEALLASLIEVGDRVLVGVFGHFGELLCSLAQRHGAIVERIEAPDWGFAVDPELIVQRLRNGPPPKLVAIVHADTSTGIVQPLQAIGQACRQSGSLLLVDAVLSVGGCELRTDDWCVDAVIGGLQKCLGGPPGLAPLAYGERARAALAERRVPPHSTYLDVRRLERTWVERVELGAAAVSMPMPMPMLCALLEALRIVAHETLPARWQRHQQVGDALKAGLEAMGLKLFGDPRHRAPMIAIVEVPEGVGEAGVRQQLLDEHAIEIMAAFGPLRGRVWRIGSMGYNARPDRVLRVLDALESVLVSRGVHVLPGAGVRAAQQRLS